MNPYDNYRFDYTTHELTNRGITNSNLQGDDLECITREYVISKSGQLLSLYRKAHPDVIAGKFRTQEIDSTDPHSKTGLYVYVVENITNTIVLKNLNYCIRATFIHGKMIFMQLYFVSDVEYKPELCYEHYTPNHDKMTWSELGSVCDFHLGSNYD